MASKTNFAKCFQLCLIRAMSAVDDDDENSSRVSCCPETEQFSSSVYFYPREKLLRTFLRINIFGKLFRLLCTNKMYYYYCLTILLLCVNISVNYYVLFRH